MQKKKNDSKVNLPNVGITKANENSKNYTSKAALNKARDVDDKNIYFEMPSIHQNDVSMKGFIEFDQNPLRKVQVKILKMYQNFKENKMAQEWDLYIKKSQIVNSRSSEFFQIEDFLVKSLYRLAQKLNENHLLNSFSFSKTFKLNQNQHSQFNRSSIAENGKNILEDKSYMGKEQKSPQKNALGSILDDKSRSKGQGVRQSLQETGQLFVLQQQNVLLEKKVELYEKRIMELQTLLQKFEEKQKEIDGEKDLNNELINLTMAKNKYKHDSEVKTLQIDTLNRELKLTKDINAAIKANFEQLQADYLKTQKQNNVFKEYLKYKQLWAMATEQSNTWRVLYQQQKQQSSKYTSKIKMLKDKNKQLLNYFNMSNVVNVDQEQDKQDLDKIIKEFKEWLQIMAVPKVSVNQEEGDPSVVAQTLGNTEINVKFLRPNFYIFFQAYEKTLLMQKNIINIRPIEYNFFMKIRVIFDTMFNSFQIAQSYKEYPSFPQFVVGFMQKYELHSITNLLQFRKKPIQNEEKVTFLVNLFNKNFCNTWECDLFKSFLFEQYTLDEIYFFLDCRNQFNSGISTTCTLGAPDPISYVKLSKALKIVAKKLSPYENYIIERVKNILKSKKTTKYGESFIDKNFVLKLLLEVYVLQRVKSERIFESSFKSKMKKSYITFGDFHHFMNKNFSFLSSIQIAQLYRQIYALSSGHITFKAIHYMCGMKGLFIPLLLAKRMNKNILEQSLTQDMLLLDIQNNLTKTSIHFEEFGAESFMKVENSINNFMRQLDWYKQNKSAFFHRLYQEQSNILKLNTLLFLKGSYEVSPGQKIQNSEVQTHMMNLHSLLHNTDPQVPFLTRQKEKKQRALNMLVRNFKIRIQESMLEFEKVNENEIKKLKEQIQKNVVPVSAII